MRIAILVSFIYCLLSGQVIAQSNVMDDSQDNHEIISYSGGYGHFFTGPAWINPGDLVNHLQQPEVFGSSLKWNNTGITAGAEGYAELHRLLVGFGAYGMMIQDMEADSGMVRFAHGGALVKAGYAVYQTPKYFLSVMAGFGGGLIYTGIDNESQVTPIYFSSNEPVLPRRDQDYYRGYIMYELAVGNKFIATTVYPDAKRYGGFMVGLDFGATFGFPVDTWRDDNSSVTGIPNPGNIFSPFIRLTVGGGGFRKQVVNRG
jgi:hypothetical protein